MIKKIYAVLFTLSLMAASPTFGMWYYTYTSNTSKTSTSKKCDGCERSAFNTCNIQRTTNSIQCSHVLCKECKNRKAPTHYYSCPYCPWIHNQTIGRNQDNHNLQNNGQRGQDWPLQRENNNRPTHIPIHQNPNNPGQAVPPTNSVIINNQLKKWFGLTCVAGVVCYGTYKVYH